MTVRKDKKTSKSLNYEDADSFLKSREQILLDSEEEQHATEDHLLEDAVMDLPSDQDSEDMASEEEESWGKSKKVFYSADTDAQDLADEAIEARKIQKKKLQQLDLEDFLGPKPSKVETKASHKDKSKVVTIDVSSDDEAEDIEDFYKDPSELEGVKGDDLIDLLPEEKKLDLISKHSPEVRNFVTEFQKRVAEVIKYVEPAVEKLKSVDTDKGLSFLETKYQLLIGYCANIAFYLTLKVAGKKVDRHPVIERLVKYRLLIEKIKPMEAKFQYQIDKLLHTSSSSQNGASRATSEKELAFKPNLDFSDVAEDDEKEYDGVYRAPKIAPVHYQNAKKGDKLEEREKLLASKSRLMADIQADMEDKPEEEVIDPVYGKSRSNNSSKKREEYEEENYMRFTLSKKDQRKLDRTEQKPIDELEDLNDFFREREKPLKKTSNAMKELMGIKSAEAKPAKVNYEDRKRAQKEDNLGSDMSEIEDDMVEDDFYKAAKKKADKSHMNQTRPVPYKQLKTVPTGSARPASYEMMKNKGLTPHRPKDVRNPRVHHRMKWEKAQKKIKSFKPVVAASKSRYGGESSGIRTNISRSVKF